MLVAKLQDSNLLLAPNEGCFVFRISVIKKNIGHINWYIATRLGQLSRIWCCEKNPFHFSCSLVKYATVDRNTVSFECNCFYCWKAFLLLKISLSVPSESDNISSRHFLCRALLQRDFVYASKANITKLGKNEYVWRIPSLLISAVRLFVRKGWKLSLAEQ